MRVDFYLLGENKTVEQVVFALINKGYQEGWRLGVHITDENVISNLDQTLWTKDPNSFIPHQIIKTTRCQSSQEPVMLFTQAPDDIESLDYFINCTNNMSHYNKQSGRIADIVSSSEAAKIAGRERYSTYKQQDCDLNHYTI